MHVPYTSGGVVTTVDTTLENGNVSPTDSTASVQFNTNGTTTVSQSTGGVTVAGADWVRPASLGGGSWEIKADIVSGSAGAGSSATGSWLALSSARLWNAIRTLDAPLGTTECVLDISIRRVGGSVTKVARYTLRATVN